MNKILRRFTKSVIKKLLYIFNKNPDLLKLLNLTIYENSKDKKIFLKHNLDKKYIVHANDIVSKNFFVNEDSDFVILQRSIKILKTTRLLKNASLDYLIFVGGNIGVVPIEAVKNSFCKRAIVFEAYKKNFNILISNIYINDLANKIKAYHTAISDKKRFVFMKEYSAGNLGDVRLIESKKLFKRSEQVNCNTLNYYISKESITKNSLVVIDVQGHEPYVFRGSGLVIKKKIPIVFEFDPKLMTKNYLSYFKILFNNYKFFYDLHDSSTIKNIFNEENILNLQKKLKNNYTDLMIV
jgi:FkbM family methyltransferase